MKIKFTYLFAALMFAFAIGSHAQYLKVSGKQIVDANGKLYMLRGMGLGGWMLQEGYMLETGDFAGTQSKIRAKITEITDEAFAEEFYKAWRANHCTKTDVDSLASWGFNSIRLPMHYNLFTLPIEKEMVAGTDTWIETGFLMVDSLVKWCKANNMYLILDLHAAPGGQGKDENISDYNPALPSLWESPENQRKTVALWKKLAERYANETTIGGYDLINEPNWAFRGKHRNGCDETDNPEIRKLYMDITAAIREVDKNHIIFIEGNCWANNFKGILPSWDNNLVISFHRYWNPTDVLTIQGFLDLRDRYNMPLWMGESGENSNQWFYETILLLEKHDIGWSWWPMKKINSVVGPLTVKKTPEYQTLLNYWQNGGQKPDKDFAKKTLLQITENLKMENCIFRPDVPDAMFRQQNNDKPIAYKKHVIPGKVYAVDYDMGRHNVAYNDKVYMNGGGLGWTTWNNGWVYRNDGVDIEATQDANNGLGYAVSWTDDGEWLMYTVEVPADGSYRIDIRYASAQNTGKVKLELISDGSSIETALPLTGSWLVWNNIAAGKLNLKAGKNTIKLHIVKGGFSIAYLDIQKI